MGKGTQLNCGIHEQTNMGPVRKFKAVHILTQNGERIFAFVSLNVVLAGCLQKGN